MRRVKTRRLGKKIGLSLLLLAVLYGLWLGIQLIQFKSYQNLSPPLSPHEIIGSYHIHSTLSDGQKKPDKIAEIAARSSLDFIILTDHGAPNWESLASKGWKQGILVLAGSEISSNRGHLVALGFKKPARAFSTQAEEASFQVNKLGGFSIIAHPYSKTRWSWGDYAEYSGIEIINADSMLRKNILPTILYLPALLIKPELPSLKMLNKPIRALNKWDDLNQKHTNAVYGYFSADAHLLYGPLFSLLKLHVLLENPLSQQFEEAEHQVYSALKQGHFFSAVDAAAPAAGFRFWGEAEGNKIPMGENLTLERPVTLYIKIPDFLTCEVLLIHNRKAMPLPGKSIRRYLATHPGTYRIEVYLREKTPLHKNCPWIVSNPIFLKEKNHGQN